MTYVQYVNCSKWKKIIGIGLWIGASIGISFCLMLTIQIYGTEQDGLFLCHDFISGSASDKYGMVTTKCEPDYQSQMVLLIITSALNVANYSMVWRTLNNYYRWIEIKCGERPLNGDVD